MSLLRLKPLCFLACKAPKQLALQVEHINRVEIVSLFVLFFSRIRLEVNLAEKQICIFEFKELN